MIKKILYFTFYFFFTLNLLADELILYVVRPSQPVIWSSPAALVSSLLYTSERHSDMPIGHIAVELNCFPLDNENNTIHFYDGMSLQSEDPVMKNVEKGFGLYTLLFDYPGYLHGESFKKVIDDLSCKEISFWEKTQMTFIKMKLSHSTCLRLNDYYTQFKLLGLDKIYGGLNSRPLLNNGGANCSTFGVSFLEVGDLLNKDMHDNWYRRKYFPKNLMGTVEKPVGITELLYKGLFWSRDSEKGFFVEVSDPELIYNWVNEKIQSKGSNSTFLVEKLCHKTKGIFFDFSANPTPQTPIFKKL